MMSINEREQAEWQERNVIIPISLNNGTGNAIGRPHGGFAFTVDFAKVIHTITQEKHGSINPQHVPDFSNTEPRISIRENKQWNDPASIVSFHTRGHRAAIDNLDLIKDGLRFWPTIAITQSVFLRPEIIRAVEKGNLQPDGEILLSDGSTRVTDVNIDPVWKLSGVAERIGLDLQDLRTKLYEITGIEELIERDDIDLFLPPIDGPNIHIFGDVERLQNAETKVAARSHDFCRDGDNYAARCTCAPFKEYAIEECVRMAQEGGVGIMVYHPEEGRNLGSVIKHLVYNKRERHPEGDNPNQYFEATHSVMGGEDARMHWTKPDSYNWLLPHRRIDEWYSESPHKRRQLEKYGIQVGSSIALPENRIPALANVEITAKREMGGYKGIFKEDHVSGI